MNSPNACSTSPLDSQGIAETTEVPESPDVVPHALGERQRLADHPGASLPQRTPEPLDVVGQPVTLPGGHMPLGRDGGQVGRPQVGTDDGPVPVSVGQRVPQELGRRLRAVADDHRHDLPGVGVEGHPHPPRLPLRPHEAPEFVALDGQVARLFLSGPGSHGVPSRYRALTNVWSHDRETPTDRAMARRAIRSRSRRRMSSRVASGTGPFLGRATNCRPHSRQRKFADPDRLWPFRTTCAVAHPGQVGMGAGVRDASCITPRIRNHAEKATTVSR